MKIAVLTLTRDRLDYTKHCFGELHRLAGCEFDHYVLDQGSKDGTPAWLLGDYWNQAEYVYILNDNIGIPAGLNHLIEQAFARAEYDVVVKFDNDCELVQEGTLREVARLALQEDVILSPCIQGLQNPPAAIGAWTAGDELILDVLQIGGIFYAVPAYAYNSFHYDARFLLFDDEQICWWWRSKGGACGYVDAYSAWHYETTDGQRLRYPGYFERKDAEYATARTPA